MKTNPHTQTTAFWEEVATCPKQIWFEAFLDEDAPVDATPKEVNCELGSKRHRAKDKILAKPLRGHWYAGYKAQCG